VTEALTERGKFIVFEGGEGTGKSTQARLLADALGDVGPGVVLTREPGGAPGAEALRRLLVEAPPEAGWAPLSETLLHYAARNEHLEKTIRPALARGLWVISDRFADSTTAYQGAGLAVGSDVFDCLSRLVIGDLAPDLTIILDLDSEQALARAAARCPTRDRYESMNLEFHRRIRTAFIEIAQRGGRRYAVIDAAPDLRQVQQAVRDAVRARLGIEVPG
jgi:dTMP kinase